MSFIESQIICLHTVSEFPDNLGRYKLEPFDSDEFNQEFDEKNIYRKLDSLGKYLFGVARYVEVFDRPRCNDKYISIQIDDEFGTDEITVPDIVRKIDYHIAGVDFEYFILVNQDCTEYCWVVIELGATTFKTWY